MFVRDCQTAERTTNRGRRGTGRRDRENIRECDRGKAEAKGLGNDWKMRRNGKATGTKKERMRREHLALLTRVRSTR